MQKTIVLLVLLLSVSSVTGSQRVATLQSLTQLSAEDLSTAIVRLDYRGEAEKSPVLLFATKGTEVDWNRLRVVPGLEIGDWESRYTRLSFTVTVEDMKRFIEVAKTAVMRKQEEEAWLSLVIVWGIGPQEKTFRGSVSREKAGEFFIFMRYALRADPKDIRIMNGAANYDAMNILQSFGCALGLLPQVIPAKDVTNAVAVTRGGLRFNYQEHRFESTVTLRNISNQPIRAPISLVVDLSPNISLANAHGHTCVTTPLDGSSLPFQFQPRCSSRVKSWKRFWCLQAWKGKTLNSPRRSWQLQESGRSMPEANSYLLNRTLVSAPRRHR